MAIQITDALQYSTQEHSASQDGSDTSSPISNGLPPFGVDLDFGDDDGDDGGDDISPLTQQVDSAAGPARRSRRPPSTAERKATHNAVERARRETLNTRFMDLAHALPSMANVKRPSKAIIVNKSIEFIFETRDREARLHKENEQLRQEISALRARLQVSANNTSVPTSSGTVDANPAPLVDNHFSGYTTAPQNMSHLPAQAQQFSAPRGIVAARQGSYSGASTGASPRSIGSAPELSPQFTLFNRGSMSMANAGAGNSMPTTFFNYSPVSSDPNGAHGAPAQAPSPPMSSTSNTDSHSPAPMQGHVAYAGPGAALNLWGSQGSEQPNNSLLFNSVVSGAPAGTGFMPMAQPQQSGWGPYNHVAGVPLGVQGGIMGFGGML